VLCCAGALTAGGRCALGRLRPPSAAVSSEGALARPRKDVGGPRSVAMRCGSDACAAIDVVGYRTRHGSARMQASIADGFAASRRLRRAWSDFRLRTLEVAVSTEPDIYRRHWPGTRAPERTGVIACCLAARGLTEHRRTRSHANTAGLSGAAGSEWGAAAARAWPIQSLYNVDIG
jgi:hypothetical protein